MTNSAPQPPARYNLAADVASIGPARQAEQVALTMVHGVARRHWRWSELWGRMAAWQTLLEKERLQTGDRIVIFLPNCPDVPALLLAATAIGLVPVVLSPQLQPAELAYITQNCEAALIVCEHPLPALSKHPQLTLASCQGTLDDAMTSGQQPRYAQLSANQPAYMVYTSGTTGSPRGVLHAHRAVWARRMMREGWTGIQADDVILHAGQLNWTYAMGLAVFDAWSNGARSVIYEGPRTAQRWAELIQEENATIFAAVPGVYRQLLRDIPLLQEQTTSLRHALCAGEALPASLWEEWTTRLHKPLYEALGMSECSTYISSGPATPTRPGSPGRPQPGRRVAVLPVEGGDQPLPQGEEGVLAIHHSDPGLMLEYFNDPQATRNAYRGDWFLTGDVVRFDGEGYLHYCGRSDDTINALGYRVGPTEVEAVLSKHPAVSEVAVTAFQPREGVSLVCAHLVLREGERWDEATEAGIRALAGEELAAYKQPRVYHIHDALPRSRSGKILRRVLRERAKGVDESHA